MHVSVYSYEYHFGEGFIFIKVSYVKDKPLV